MATWKIDPVHATADFAARHMMVAIVRGGFKGITGTIEFDPAKPEAARVEAVIDTRTMTSTGMDQRDAHLKSPDFLDVEKYPTITFKSTQVTVTGENTAKVTGNLTIRDVTRAVVIDTEFLGVLKGLDGQNHGGFTGTTKINREDWGLTWNMALETGGWLVGKEITITLDVEVVPATEAVPA
jgi:polyisoprenoid-binding protein YceI